MKKIVLSTIATFVVTFGLGIITNFFYSRLDKAKELDYWYSIFLNHYIFIVLLLVLVFFIFIQVSAKLEFNKLWHFSIKTSRLDASNHFRIQKYVNFKINRSTDNIILNLLMNHENILVTGKPNIGKTRSAFDAIQSVPGFRLLIPSIRKNDEKINLSKIKIPYISVPFTSKKFYLFKARFILFLDDVESVCETNIFDVIKALENKASCVIVVATCRTGNELEEVQESEPKSYRDFFQNNVLLEEITQEEGQLLSTTIGKDFDITKFDGTPGGITLDYAVMRNRYKINSSVLGKTILKSIKLLNAVNNKIFTYDAVQYVCREIWKVPQEALQVYKWEEEIRELQKLELISPVKDKLISLH
jgi:hypothetical protein